MMEMKVREVEKGLGTNFPEDLKRLLCETYGVKEEYGIDFLWSVKRIHENLNFRTCKVYKEITVIRGVERCSRRLWGYFLVGRLFT